MGRVKWIWYLSPMRAAKVQASLRIRAVSPEPPLLVHTSSESRGSLRQKARSLALLNGWAYAVKICHDGMLEDTNSLDTSYMVVCIFFFFFFLRYMLLNNKVQVQGQIFFAKDCMPCNRLCRNCSCNWSIFRRCLSLNKGYRYNPTEICQQRLRGVRNVAQKLCSWERSFSMVTINTQFYDTKLKNVNMHIQDLFTRNHVATEVIQHLTGSQTYLLLTSIAKLNQNQSNSTHLLLHNVNVLSISGRKCHKHISAIQ